jgi:regulator of replication initiation timing
MSIIDIKTIYHYDYIELKCIKQKGFSKLHKNNQFLENTLYIECKIILINKFNINKALKKIYNYVEKYIMEHYENIHNLKDTLVRAIMENLSFVISNELYHHKLSKNTKIHTIDSYEMLTLIPNIEKYNIIIRKNTNYIILPSIVIDYINIIKDKIDNKTIYEIQELLRILLFIK